MPDTQPKRNKRRGLGATRDCGEAVSYAAEAQAVKAGENYARGCAVLCRICALGRGPGKDAAGAQWAILA